MKRASHVTSFISAALALLALAGPASAQTQSLEGDWVAGHVSGEPVENDAAFQNNCVFAKTMQIQLSVSKTATGFEGHMTQVITVQVLGGAPQSGIASLEALKARCSLRNLTNPLLGAQAKIWIWSGRQAANPNTINVATVSGECRNDWCRQVDPRFHMNPNAANFETQFVRRGNVLVDTNGTAKPEDDMVYLPRAEFARRSSEGATVATDFIKRLIAGDADGAYRMTATQAPNNDYAQSTRRAAEVFRNHPNPVRSVTTLYEQFSAREDRRAESWVITVRLTGANGATTNATVALWADQNGGRPKVSFFWVP